MEARLPTVPAAKAHGDPVVVRDGLKVVRLTIPAGVTVPEHASNVDVVVTVVRGRGSFTYEGKTHPLSPGTVIDLAPKVRHALAAEGEELELVVTHARLSAGAAPSCGA